MANDASQAVDVLREMIRKRRVKLTELAEIIGTPYKTLHNYFSHKTEMPLEVYLKLCRAAGIPLIYPIEERFALNREALASTIEKVLHHVVPHIKINDNLEVTFGSVDADAEKSDIRGMRNRVSVLAGLLAVIYDVECEKDVLFPILDD